MNNNLLSLRSLFFSVGSIHLATAALGTLIALEIAANGGTQEEAALAASAYSLGFLAGCFFISKPLSRIGHIRAFSAAAALCTMSALFLALTDNSVATTIFRLVAGLATAGLYAIGDAWINDTAGNSSRGRTLAVYSIVLGVASVFSQFIVFIYSQDFNSSFIIVSGLYCLAILSLVLTRTEPPQPAKNSNVRLAAVFQISPTAFLGVLANGIVVTIVLNVLPFAASSAGVNASAIALSVGAIYAGRIILQYPLGRASDRSDRRIIILAVSLTSALLLYGLSNISASEVSSIEGRNGHLMLIYTVVLMMLLGGGLLSLYSLLVSHAMDRTDQENISSTAVTLLFVYTLGCVVGPLIAAAVSELISDSAMTWTALGIMLGTSGLTAFRMKQREMVEPAEHAVHVPGSVTSVEMTPEIKR